MVDELGLGVTIGVSVVVFLLMFFSTIVDREKHKHIRTFFLMICLPLLFLIPASLVLESTTCEVVLNSSEDIYVYGNYFDDYHWYGYNITAPSQLDKEAFLFHVDTENTYTEYCYHKEDGSRTFIIAFSVILVVFMIYIAILFFADIIAFFKDLINKV